jgi:UDP-N-acetylglucosamine--dolichyl-phosphate N-acetylglucosaminephosphotransferase
MAIFNIQDIQLVYKLIVIFLYSYFITLWSVPYVIRKLEKYKYTVQDKYKKGKVIIPSMGGIAILIGILVSLALSQILLNKENLGSLIIFYFIVIVYALYGVVDDMFAFRKRYDKIIALLVLTFPIASLVHDTVLNLLFIHIEVGALYSLVIIPIYIMVVANMLNLHAGYNGLTQGLACILLITLGVKSYLVNGLDYMLYLIPILGAVMAFLPSTIYPAKILPGNVGDILVGAAIGAFIVINNILWFGLVILIPHIINFIMDTYTILLKRTPDVKFGKLRPDGTIEAPPTMKYKSLKFLIVSWFRLTEKQATEILLGFTAVFCVIGIVFF